MSMQAFHLQVLIFIMFTGSPSLEIIEYNMKMLRRGFFKTRVFKCILLGVGG